MIQIKQNHRPCNKKTIIKMSFAFTIFSFPIDILEIHRYWLGIKINTY